MIILLVFFHILAEKPPFSISTCPIILWSLGARGTADGVKKYGGLSSKLRFIEISYVFGCFKARKVAFEMISISVKLLFNNFGKKSFGKHCLQRAEHLNLWKQLDWEKAKI